MCENVNFPLWGSDLSEKDLRNMINALANDFKRFRAFDNEFGIEHYQSGNMPSIKIEASRRVRTSLKQTQAFLDIKYSEHSCGESWE